MKISGSFLTMLLIWALGFTHFLGGPYMFFKIIFWLALLPFFIFVFLFLLFICKVRKVTKIGEKIHRKQETLHVEAEVKE